MMGWGTKPERVSCPKMRVWYPWDRPLVVKLGQRSLRYPLEHHCPYSPGVHQLRVGDEPTSLSR